MLKLFRGNIIFIALCISFISCQKEYPIADAGSIEEEIRLSGNNAFSLRTNNEPETQPHTYEPVTIQVSANCGGFWKGLPGSYNTTTQKYPLLIFLNGKSSHGDGSQEALNDMHGPIHVRLKNKTFPRNFVSGGNNYSFIVITPQFKDRAPAADVNTLINYFTSTLRVDKSRIYVTGISMGGGEAWDYAGKYASKIAAIAPVCGGHTPTQFKAKTIASNNLPCWAFHNDGDPTVPVERTIDFVNMINNFRPTTQSKMTIFSGDVHNAWDAAYRLTYKENNMNLFEWLLQYQR